MGSGEWGKRNSHSLLPTPHSPTLNVEVLHIERVVFNEASARLDLVAHQHGEDFVGLDRVVDPDLQERAFFGVHRRLPQLLRVHFAQAFVALNRQILLGRRQNVVEHFVARGDLGLDLALLDDERRLAELDERFVQLDRALKFDVRGQFPINQHARAVVGKLDLDLEEAVLLIGDQIGLETGFGQRGFDLAEQALVGEDVMQLTALFLHQAFTTGQRLQRRVHNLTVVQPAFEFIVVGVELDQPLEQAGQFPALDRLTGLFDLDRNLFGRLAHEETVHLSVVFDVPLGPALFDFVEGRLRDVDVTLQIGLDHAVLVLALDLVFEQLRHLAVEERQQQRADVRPVYVRVSHQNNFVITQLLDVEISLANAGAERGDQRFDLVVREHLVEARLLDVENLAFEREDRLRAAVAALLRAPAGAVAFDNV